MKAAKNRLDANLWDYLVGATETETTMRRNRMGIDALAFRPRVLRDVSEIDTTSTILGKAVRLPVFLAELTGIHPTVEGIVVQVALLVVYALGAAYVFAWRPARERRAAQAEAA